jgi:phosphate/sulfate permease
LFGAEALLLSLVGSVLGVAGAVGYGQLMMTGLRTWWVGAVGTTALTLHVSPESLIAGAAGGVIAALICIWWTLRALEHRSERSLLAGQSMKTQWPPRHLFFAERADCCWRRSDCWALAFFC